MLSPSQIVSLIAGALTMMVQGSLYTFGTITPYIASFLYYQGKVVSIKVKKMSQ
jgi:hypothetical protein